MEVRDKLAGRGAAVTTPTSSGSTYDNTTYQSPAHYLPYSLASSVSPLATVRLIQWEELEEGEEQSETKEWDAVEETN